MTGHTRCLAWASCCALVAFAFNACAQGQAMPVESSAPPSWVIELLKAGGLPGVVGMLGWWLGKGGGITLTVRL